MLPTCSESPMRSDSPGADESLSNDATSSVVVLSSSPDGSEGLPDALKMRSTTDSGVQLSSEPSSIQGTMASAPTKTHPHPHPHPHPHSHSHSNSHSTSRHLDHRRTLSTASTASLSVPGSTSRTPSRSMSRNTSFEYKETLDAKSRDLEDGSRIINQYRMTSVIGQGAYGTVHRATLVDDPSVEFAIKEFGKTRLRKNQRASNMRRPNGRSGMRTAGGVVSRLGSNPPSEVDLKPGTDDRKPSLEDPLMLIRREIAILKKLNHPYVVKLFEVLDDPSKDSLYMVFEHCPDGRVIDVKLHENVKPLDEDTARAYFIQILLGVEYLHSNDIVHRDIKPDNILLSDHGKTCKIVDFGVSEMFVKPGDDTMEKSAGSPAFMSPELCTAGHSAYHGRKDDIWSLGVTLYCMVVGHLPFNKDNFYEMYEAIKNEEPEWPSHLSADLADLLKEMLTKDPEKRITVADIREHPWVKAAGTRLIPVEANVKDGVFEITDEDLDCAICKISNIFTVARAVSRFKKAGSMGRARREASRSSEGSGDQLPTAAELSASPLAMEPQAAPPLMFDSPKSDAVELTPIEEVKSFDLDEAPPIVLSESPSGSGSEGDDPLVRRLADIAIEKSQEIIIPPEPAHPKTKESAQRQKTIKVLDEPTVSSPSSDNIPTPPGASNAYLSNARFNQDMVQPVLPKAAEDKLKKEAKQGSSPNQ